MTLLSLLPAYAIPETLTKVAFESHVVEQHPFAETPEGHTPTALCEKPLR
jgi:hypothetical protein